MKPLFLLLFSFILGITIAYVLKGDPHLTFNGNLSMALKFCFTAIGHFKYGKGMTMMLPPALPSKEAAVFISGIAEILLAIGLLIPSTRYISAILLIIMLALMLPANIYAALHHVDYEKGTYDGKGPSYLWFRIPMQLFLVAWIVYFSMIRL